MGVIFPNDDGSHDKQAFVLHALFQRLEMCIPESARADVMAQVRYGYDGLGIYVTFLGEIKKSHVRSIIRHIKANYFDQKVTVRSGIVLIQLADNIQATGYSSSAKHLTPPQLGERALLMLLSKEERVNIPGDLAEEYGEIAAKHGERFAKVWYYKQVAASAWPLIRKAIRWGVLAWVEEWIRRRV